LATARELLVSQFFMYESKRLLQLYSYFSHIYLSYFTGDHETNLEFCTRV
jgi:hypothetical protein